MLVQHIACLHVFSHIQPAGLPWLLTRNTTDSAPGAKSGSLRNSIPLQAATNKESLSSRPQHAFVAHFLSTFCGLVYFCLCLVQTHHTTSSFCLSLRNPYGSGHSMGGALATLAAYDIRKRLQKAKKEDVEVMCYSFGAPRTGNHAFARDYNHVVPDTWSIINDQVRFSKSWLVAPKKIVLSCLPLSCVFWLPFASLLVFVYDLQHSLWPAPLTTT